MVKVPDLSRDDMSKIANDFLDCRIDYSNMPVNIEMIIENEGITIIPFESLKRRYDVDAFTSIHMKCIYIDERQYMAESLRYRFTLAHELAHIIAHKPFLSSLRSDQAGDYSNAIDSLSRNEYDYFEVQADTIGSFLLIPKHVLDIQYKFLLEETINNFQDPNSNHAINVIQAIIPSRLAGFFKVSRSAMETRLSKDKFNYF